MRENSLQEAKLYKETKRKTIARCVQIQASVTKGRPCYVDNPLDAVMNSVFSVVLAQHLKTHREEGCVETPFPWYSNQHGPARAACSGGCNG